MIVDKISCQPGSIGTTCSVTLIRVVQFLGQGAKLTADHHTTRMSREAIISESAYPFSTRHHHFAVGRP
jgi:hypothetical protein